MKRRTPQEKKALSYEKDRRNSYGENDKASRKSIPKRKAEVNRGYRRKVDSVVSGIILTNGVEEASELADSASAIKRREWKKVPDRPLGEVVERKLSNRELNAGQGKTARKVARKFIEDLKIEVKQLEENNWIARALDFPKLETVGESQQRAVEKFKHIAMVAYRNEYQGGDMRVQIDGVFLRLSLSRE